jgi:hypothetical protein
MTRVGSWAAAAILAVAATVLPGATTAPAAAAACTDAGGITVVVDPGSLTGALSQTCVASGGDDAAALFAAAGHTLERVQRFPGAVCRVDGQPESAGCVNMPPTNAYWGLFWSNGTSGSWAYASEGVDSLSVPAGGSVAFAWQASSSHRKPAAAPPDHDGSEPDGDGSGTGGTGGGTGSGTGGGSGGSTGGSTGGSGGSPGSGSGDGTPSASPSDSPSASASPRERARDRDRDREARASDRPRDEESEGAEPTDDATVQPGDERDDVPAASSDAMADGGLPLWLVGLAALGLLAVGTAVAVVRRRAPGAGGA